MVNLSQREQMYAIIPHLPAHHLLIPYPPFFCSLTHYLPSSAHRLPASHPSFLCSSPAVFPPPVHSFPVPSPIASYHPSTLSNLFSHRLLASHPSFFRSLTHGLLAFAWWFLPTSPLSSSLSPVVFSLSHPWSSSIRPVVLAYFSTVFWPLTRRFPATCLSLFRLSPRGLRHPVRRLPLSCPVAFAPSPVVSLFPTRRFPATCLSLFRLSPRGFRHLVRGLLAICPVALDLFPVGFLPPVYRCFVFRPEVPATPPIVFQPSAHHLLASSPSVSCHSSIGVSSFAQRSPPFARRLAPFRPSPSGLSPAVFPPPVYSLPVPSPITSYYPFTLSNLFFHRLLASHPSSFRPLTHCLLLPVQRFPPFYPSASDRSPVVFLPPHPWFFSIRPVVLAFTSTVYQPLTCRFPVTRPSVFRLSPRGFRHPSGGSRYFVQWLSTSSPSFFRSLTHGLLAFAQWFLSASPPSSGLSPVVSLPPVYRCFVFRPEVPAIRLAALAISPSGSCLLLHCLPAFHPLFPCHLAYRFPSPAYRCSAISPIDFRHPPIVKSRRARGRTAAEKIAGAISRVLYPCGRQSLN